LHAVAETVVVVLGLDDRERLIPAIAQKIVDAPLTAPSMESAAHDNPAGGIRHLLPYLGLDIPAGLFQGRGDVFGADVPLAQGVFIAHA